MEWNERFAAAMRVARQDRLIDFKRAFRDFEY